MGYAFKVDQEVGPWTLVEPLGEGGNAEVWVAARDGETVALKILRQRNAESEPYQRFRQETEFMRTLGDRPGVLPLLDASIPERPSKDDRAWLAMPIARPLPEALDGEPLETVVAAFAGFADVLASLAAEFDFAHRDIKPKNLYRWEDTWCVGDFGLVELPDADAITAEGRTIGPLYFLAPEVLHCVEPVDYKAADVWSLAKSLWAVAVGQQWPMQGQLRADQPGLRVQDLAPHARAAGVDRLIEACTGLAPAARPSMQAVASELEAWSREPVAAPEVLDLSAQGARLRERLAGEIEARGLAERRLEQGYDARDRLTDRLEPVARALADAYPEVEIWVFDELTDNVLGYAEGMGRPLVVWSEIAADRIVTGDQYSQLIFRVGAGVELLDDGQLRLTGLIGFGREGESGHELVQVEERFAPVGTTQADSAVDELANELIGLVPAWLERFIESLPLT